MEPATEINKNIDANFLDKIKLYTSCKWTHIQHEIISNFYSFDGIRLSSIHIMFSFLLSMKQYQKSFHSASKTMAVSSVIKAHITPLFHQLHISDVLSVVSIPFDDTYPSSFTPLCKHKNLFLEKNIKKC